MSQALRHALATVDLPAEAQDALWIALTHPWFDANLILPHFDPRAHPFILADLEHRCRKSIVRIDEVAYDWRREPPDWLARWHLVHHTVRPFVKPYTFSFIHPALQ